MVISQETFGRQEEAGNLDLDLRKNRVNQRNLRQKITNT